MAHFKTDVENLRQAKADAKQLEIFHRWSQAHPEFDYQAAHALLKDYYHGEEWTFENLQESAERLVAKGVISKLPPKTKEEIVDAEMEQREALVNFVISNRQMSPQTAREERKRLMSPRLTSIETVRTIAENVKNRRRLEALPPADLKSLAAGQRATQPELPENISREQILHLLDAAQLKHIIARYGADAVTRRVNEGREKDE
jgi:hypothetical protein